MIPFSARRTLMCADDGDFDHDPLFVYLCTKGLEDLAHRPRCDQFEKRLKSVF